MSSKMPSENGESDGPKTNALQANRFFSSKVSTKLSFSRSLDASPASFIIRDTFIKL